MLLRRKQKESALISFRVITTSKTQVPRQELLTDAYLSISEDEAYTPRRRERPSGENMWKTFGLQTEGCDTYSTN